MGVVFVEIGVLIRRVITKFELKKENFVIIPIGILISFIAAYLNSPVDFNGNTYGNIILMFFGAVPVSISIMIACRSIFSIHRRERLLSYLGQHTLFIMGFDLLSLNFTKVVLGMMGIENWINVFIFKMILLLVGSLIWTKIIDLIPNKKISKVLRY